MSVESRLQATLPAHLTGEPDIESAIPLGSTSSMTLEFLQLTCSFSSGSDRQSVRKIEPRASATKNSLPVVGWAHTVVRGWGKLITYAVGCERVSGSSSIEPAGLGAEGMWTLGFRSQTNNILSSLC